MTGVTGLRTEARAADGRSRMRLGGSLLAAGAAAWLVRSVLMVVGLAFLLWGVLGVFALDFDRVVTGLTVSLLAYTGATIALVLGSLLLGAGLLVHQGGVDSLSWTDGAGRPFAPSSGTRLRAKASAGLLFAHAALALLAIGALLGMMGVGSTEVEGLAAGLAGAVLVAWIVSTVVLLAAAGLARGYLVSLRTELAAPGPSGGVGFLAYAIADLVGVALFLGALLLRDAGGGVPLFAGAILELLVVPIIGIVAFGLLIGTGLRMRNLEPGPYPQPLLPLPVLLVYAPAAPPPPPPGALPLPPPPDPP